MAAPLRPYAAAFLTATAAAMVVDAALQLALEAVRVSGRGTGVPWWITANLIGRGRWVVLAGLLWWLLPQWPERPVPQWPERPASEPPGPDIDSSRPEAWRRVGVAVVTVPLLWVLATWIVTAIRFTLLASWTTDGRVFLAPDYYRGVILEYVPWLMAGLVILALRRHL